MIAFLFLVQNLCAQEEKSTIVDQTRVGISRMEKRQREALSQIFSLNRRIKSLARKRSEINSRLMSQEAAVRQAAQDLNLLENKTIDQKAMLNRRLRQLYQGQDRHSLQLLFSARTPVELERNHRFLKRMIDVDHDHLKNYLAHLRAMKSKREALKAIVAQLAESQREMDKQEKTIISDLREKSVLVAKLREDKNLKIAQLRELRDQSPESQKSYAFFERRGLMTPPIEAIVKREYGAFVDFQHRFQLMHKGIFYSVDRVSEVRAVHSGKVALAAQIPGYGETMIIDHGDSYYSVYAHLRHLKHKEGANVHEGEVLALTGDHSPLFGPGLYFELRHFADAIDPKPWIKESVMKTANSF